MEEQHVVAIFPTIDAAQRAREDLIRDGFNDNEIRISSETVQASAPDASGSQSVARESDTGGGFLSWLFGTDVPDKERDWYGTQLREGRTALSVRAVGDKRARAEDLLDLAGAMELDIDWEETGAEAGAKPTMIKADAPVSSDLETAPRTEAGGMGASSARVEANKMGQSEEVIPVIKEEMSVGKRQTEKRQRIRTHVIERPVEAQVTLQDETVILERRPITGKTAVEPGDLQDRDVEIIERTEEPVVEKRTEAEELVVHKDIRQRTETVKDKVRETKVDVDKNRDLRPDAHRQ